MLVSHPDASLNDAMDDHQAFLQWFRTTWAAGEDALHRGDPRPRAGTWTAREPVTLFGAWLTATGPAEVGEAFARIAGAFTGPASSEVEVLASGVGGDLAYTVHREHTTVTVDGTPRIYTLRVTQVYRREDGAWKVVHRHGDEESTRG